jgi:hypothetical protein
MRNKGLLPPINDILASIVVAAAYLLRFAYVGDPLHRAPIWLVIAADFVLPAMAGAYLFVVAVFVAIDRYDGG